MSQLQDKPQQFSIATLLLVMTLIGVYLALFRASVVLGALSLVLIVPALVRTTLLTQRERRFGGRLTAAEKVAVFLGSLVVVMFGMSATLGASVVVFLAGLLTSAAALPLGDGAAGGIAFLASIVSLIAGACTAWMMFRMTWPLREEFVEQLHRGDLVHIPETRRGTPRKS